MRSAWRITASAWAFRIACRCVGVSDAIPEGPSRSSAPSSRGMCFSRPSPAWLNPLFATGHLARLLPVAFHQVADLKSQLDAIEASLAEDLDLELCPEIRPGIEVRIRYGVLRGSLAWVGAARTERGGASHGFHRPRGRSASGGGRTGADLNRFKPPSIARPGRFQTGPESPRYNAEYGRAGEQIPPTPACHGA